ncbi:MAG: hypothetical protein ABI697_03265 [Devosia sp.]
MRVVIHAGRHKTGTTSLQMAMDRSRDILAAAGIHYPAAPNGQHIGLLNLRQPGWTPERLLAERAFAVAAGAHTLFLSAEGLSVMSAEQLRRLGTALHEDELTFLYCFRHWHNFWPSRWAQNCKRRDTQGFESYLDMIARADLQHPDVYYDVVIERALSVAGAAVKAVSFDRAVPSAEGLLATLLTAVELPSALVAAVVANERRENARYPWQVIEILRLLNGIIADAATLPQDDLCLAVAESRRPKRSFELAGVWPDLDAGLAASLTAIADSHRVDRTLERRGLVAQASGRLARHAGLFANAVEGQIFEAIPACTVTTTDLDWREFSRRHHGLAMEAIAQLSVIPRSAVAAP